MRLMAQTLLALILVSTVACSGVRKPDSAEGNSVQTNADRSQPGSSVPGASRRNLVGDPLQPGPFKFQLKIPAGSRAAVHRHSIDVNVKVLSGAIFIVIGEPLESSRAQRFEAGTTFMVPAHTWHDEWWEVETVLEAEGVGPMKTSYKDQ